MTKLINSLKNNVLVFALFFGVSTVLSGSVVHAQEWADGCSLCESTTGWSDASYQDSYTPAQTTGWSDTSYQDSYTPAQTTGWSDTSYQDSYTPAQTTGWSDTSYQDSYTPAQTTGWSDTSYRDSYTPNYNSNSCASLYCNNGTNYNNQRAATTYYSGNSGNSNNSGGITYQNGSTGGSSYGTSGNNSRVIYRSNGYNDSNTYSSSYNNPIYVRSQDRNTGSNWGYSNNNVIYNYPAQVSNVSNPGVTTLLNYNNNTNYVHPTPFYNYNYNYNQVSAPIYRAEPQQTVSYVSNSRPSISLSQIPYTGLGDNAWYWGAIVAFASALGYLLYTTKKGMFSQALPRSTSRVMVMTLFVMAMVSVPTTKTHAQVYEPTSNVALTTGLTCSINSNTSSIDSGNAAMLTWQSVGATYATLSDNVGSVNVNGMLSVRPDSLRTYKLTIYGLYGQSAQCSTVVYVNQIARTTPSTTAVVNTNILYGQQNYNAGTSYRSYSASPTYGVAPIYSASPTYSNHTEVSYDSNYGSYNSRSRLGLSHLPYTGVGDTVAYWASIVALAGSLLYLLGYKQLNRFA